MSDSQPRIQWCSWVLYALKPEPKNYHKLMMVQYSLRSCCWLVGSGSGEPVKGVVVQEKSGDIGNILAAQSGWNL